MKRTFTRGSRFRAALLSLAVSVPLFHRQLAESLVIRGDDLLYRGQRKAAMQHYDRARLLDPALPIAADHLFFALVRQHDGDSLTRAAGVVSAALERNPNDPALLEDRALCELIARRFDRAQRDFMKAASNGHSMQDRLFARWAGRHVRMRMRAAS